MKLHINCQAEKAVSYKHGSNTKKLPQGQSDEFMLFSESYKSKSWALAKNLYDTPKVPIASFDDYETESM